jgi:hypothetical protein
MRDPKIIDAIIENINRICKINPDLRLGQLVAIKNQIILLNFNFAGYNIAMYHKVSKFKKMKHLVLICILISSCVTKTTKKESQMKLWTLSDYGKIENVISISTNLIDIERTMDELNWNKFHQVILEKPNGDLMEVGGSLIEDGLSVIYIEEGKEFIISKPPTSVSEMTNLLKMYYKGDKAYKTKYKYE